ncbi:MAG TPA: endolytic transglycosylase MltG [Candidatus Limnocylindrales bacterium]|nr:endolytic transglycosylase MltG [Candidatus Limnocylindrales bacterium]
MSIRGGGGPRDERDSGGMYRNGYHRTGRYGRGPGDQRKYERYGSRNGGLAGILKFVLFLGLLAGGVLLVMVTVARPLVRAVIVPWADDNPAALRIPFVEDLVREDIGAALTAQAPGTADEIAFTVVSGDTPATVAPRLAEQGIITSERAFLFLARQDDLATKLVAGQFALAGNLTPAQVVEGLVANRITVRTVSLTFREGLRIEQMTAKLAADDSTQIDPAEFYKLATDPPDELLADFPWLLEKGVHPKGASLEGFLYPATYDIRVGDANATTAEDLIRMMLSAFYDRVGEDRLNVPEKRGLTFYEVLTMASIVEREAVLDEERPLIAGVYQNRLNPKKWPTGLLQSDPTIFYVHDTLKLQDQKIPAWAKYVFWDALPDGYRLPKPLPDAIAGYNTYTSRGLPPGPICSPSVESIDAVLHPDTKKGYLFFIAKGDGSGSSAFAKTQAEHEKNVAKYGKN